MSNANLWWSYDPDNGSFAALPPGPLLIPAIGIFAFVALVRAIKGNGPSEKRVLGSTMYESEHYQSKRKRYYELIKKSAESGGLGLAEREELNRLERPAWGGGKYWFYS